MKGKNMRKYTDEEVYASVSPSQRAELDDLNASTKRWNMAGKVAIGSIVFLVLFLLFAS